jgi:hypothetical protein
MTQENEKNSKYEEFFKQIKKFKEEQAKQKQRGLNDYNILTAVRKAYEEVGMHSNFIYSLINPSGLHYQDDLFVNLFIKEVLKIDYFGQDIEVNVEENANGKRIDFTIKSDKYYIGIEMKVHHYDSENQLSDYHEYLIKKAKDNKEQKVIIYYLTIDGKEASKNSHQGIEYKQISFKTDILNWLNKCQNEVQNITNLNMAIEQYKDVVKIITGKYKPKAKQIYQYILEDKDLFKKAQEFYHKHENKTKYNQLNNIEKEACQAYEKARKEIAGEFFSTKLPNYLKGKFPESNIEVTINEKQYEITITNHPKGKIIFGSKGKGTNKDYVDVNGEKEKTKYQNRYSKKSINDFYYEDGKEAKEYYLSILLN